jgi:integrase
MTKRKRWLPDNVTEWTDRHGKKRYRFRKKGYPTYHFKAQPGTEEFRVENEAAQNAAPSSAKGKAVIERSLDDLVIRYYSSPAWLRMKPSSQRTYRGIIDRFRERTKGGTRYGALPVDRMTVASIDAVLGKMADTPAAANNLRKALKRLLRYAVKLGWRTDNPADLTDAYASGKGWHTWTDDEIEQYRARHPYGTRARLALELALNTAARRCNVAALDRSMLIKGKFHIEHVKGCDPTIVAASPETLKAIEALPVAGFGAFIVTEFGKPFTVAGFGNKFRDWCDQAGLPHCSIHGLRKAQSRRLAESGATQLQGRAITGHKQDRTFAYYAEKADRERLADAAMANLALANPQKQE